MRDGSLAPPCFTGESAETIACPLSVAENARNRYYSQVIHIKEYALRLLRWSEPYVKTDMVYLAGAGFWTNLNMVIVSVFALLLSIAFANILPREIYGTYQYLLSLSTLLAALCLTGMNIALSQSVARGNDGDLRPAVRLQLLWSIVPTAIGLFGAGYYAFQGNMTLALGVTVISFLTPAINAFNTYTAFLQGKREFKQLFVYGVLSNIAYYACMFPAIVIAKDAVILIFANLVVNALTMIWFYTRTLARYQPSDQTDPHTLPYGAHLSVMNAVGTIVAQLDSVLVFHFLGPAELAVYSFASLIPERVSGLFKFVTTAALPKFSVQSADEIRQHLIGKTLRAASAGVIVAVAYALSAPFLFSLLFPAYLTAAFYSQVYALMIITVAANIPAAAIVALRMNRELYAFNIGTPFILLALQVVLLLNFGIIGILLARVISNTCNILLALYFIFHPFGRREA